MLRSILLALCLFVTGCRTVETFVTVEQQLPGGGVARATTVLR